MQTVKCVVVGDGAVGKTCLLMSYTQRMFPREYIPTIFDNYSSNIDYEGQHIRLDLYDTAGQEDYDRLRVICYANTDIFLVCYSVDSQISLSNVKTKWVPELRSHAEHTPIVLVGLKSDLRKDPKAQKQISDAGQEFVSMEEAEAMQATIEAEQVVECSALRMENINECFEVGIKVALSKRNGKDGSGCCTVL